MAIAALVLSLAALAWDGGLPLSGRDGAGGAGPDAGPAIGFLDVGQGDAILLRPPGADPVLVDGGPPGAGLEAELAAAGVGRLAAVVVTHDQSDHSGGIEELLGRVPVARLLYGRASRGLLARARAAGARTVRVARGDTVRAGALSLRVLWPPEELLGAAASGADPNQLAVVLLLRWHRFAALLAADAEAEVVPLDPGPLDLLKVAHHGSEDAGLAALLERSRPALAVISVGSGNPYGHPAPSTLATLAAHGVRVARTDRDGEIWIELDGGEAKVGAAG